MPIHGYGKKCLTSAFIGSTLVVILTVANLVRITSDYSENIGNSQLKDWEITTGSNDNGLENYGGSHRRVRRDTDSGGIVEKTLALLAEGDSLIKMSNQTDIILVVGNTGSGKSTLVELLAGDNDKLESYKKSGTYLIRDLGGKISTKTTVSKSIFPELVVQNETNAAFYDCPGFSDTRNQQPYIEIGNSFFIKKVADHGTRIKIILVVNIFSLRANADRNDFPSLLKHVTILIKDVAKFQEGIALVATKVKSSESDEEEIDNIASFLNDLREELPETLPKDRVKPALQLLDAILTTKGGEYNRIGLFRAPREAGFLSKIPQVQENRHNLLQLIHHEIEYVNKSENDFGYALSPNAIILINDLVVSINRNISVGIQNVCDKIGEKISQDLQDILVDPGKGTVELLERLDKLMEIGNTQLTHNADKPSQLLDNVFEIIREFSGTTAGISNDLENLVNQRHYLDFLQNAREAQPLVIESSRWLLPVQNLAKIWTTYLSSNFTSNLHARLFDSLETVSQKIIDAYLESEVSLSKLIRSLNYLKNTQRKLETELDGIGKGLGEFVWQVISSLKYSVGSDTIIANESSIMDQINTLESISLIIPNELRLKWEPIKWMQPLDSAINRIQDEESWKEFLISLFQELSEPKVQVENEWGLKDFPLNENLNATFVDNFLNTSTIKNRGRDRVQNFFSNEHDGEIRLRALTELLNTTLAESTTCGESDEDTLTSIRGRYVALSSISTLSCLRNREPRTLVILASHTVFIDGHIYGRRVNPNGNLDVIIIAPNWKIIGPVFFDFSGASGDNLGGNRPSKASWTGSSGSPGPPGENAGHFFGIGRTFDGDSLEVTLDGGKGGSGQPGGEGGDGSKGNDAYMMGVEHSDPGWMYEEGASCWRDGDARVNQSPYGHSRDGRSGDITTYTYHGGSGSNGYSGGSGGKGGWGGYAGSFELIGMENQQKIKLSSAKRGNLGADGPGGSGGCHGTNGNEIKVDFYAKYCVGCAAYRCKFRNERTYSAGYCSKGRASSGETGGNYNGRTLPVPTNYLFEVSRGKYINSFKDWAFSELSNKFLYTSISDFLLYLDDKASPIISNQLLDMYNELITLEKAFAQTDLKNKDNLIPFYESLLKRTYTNGLKLNGDAYKANAILYGATLSKLCSMKTPLEPYLIVDIAKYFQLAKETAQNFQAQWTNQQRLAIVENSKHEYMAQIEEKLSEAQDLITNVINPEMEKIHIRIQENIERLVIEIERLRKQKLQETIALERKEEELRAQIRMYAIFGFLKMGAQIVGCLGPYGAAAGSVIGSGLGMAEQFTTPGTAPPTKIVTLPASIQNLQSDLSSQYGQYAKSKLDSFQLQITDMKRLLESDDNNFAPVNGKREPTSKPIAIMNKITEVNGKIKAQQKKISDLLKTDKSKLSADALKTLTDSENEITKSKEELKTLLKESEVSLKNEAQKTAKIQSRLQKVGQATKIVSIGTEMYAKYRGSHDQLAIISEQIEKSREEEKRIEGHKQNMYNIMIPTIENMRTNMNDFQSTLGNRSAVALEVGKWQVTSTLKDIRSKMKLFTEGFSADHDILHCFQMLEEVMTTLINVYDRLQSYGDQARMVKFISSINSAAFLNLPEVKYPELKKIVQELEIVIQANVLIQQYESALDSFKMWVFPFANLYMTGLTQIPSLSNTRDVEGLKNMAAIVGRNIHKLSAKLELYKRSIVSHDQGLHIRNFGELTTGGDGDGDSFHVWKSGEYSTEMRKLLCGEKIVLKASINNCPSGMNAIKFRKLDLKFKVVGNSSADSKLAEALEGYKVVLTHGGNSYYNYASRIVTISSKKIRISFSFSKNKSDGLPVDRNSVYEKLRTGDMVLSPYTVWEIQLFPVTENGFGRLVQFARMKIDLQMNGEGTYVIDGIGNKSPI